jgi:hypothetical protein
VRDVFRKRARGKLAQLVAADATVGLHRVELSLYIDTQDLRPV